MVKLYKNGRLCIHFSKSILQKRIPLSEMLGDEVAVYDRNVVGRPGEDLQCMFVLKCGGHLYLVRDEDLMQMAANERVWLQPMPESWCRFDDQ